MLLPRFPTFATFCFLAFWADSSTASGMQGDPLRVYLRAGAKTHGEGEHDHPRFLEDWTALLTQRGAEVHGSLSFPTVDELAETDVLVLYAADGATIRGDERTAFDAYLASGRGLVVLHDAVCGDDPHWFRTLAGGAWEHGHSKWLEGEVGLYFTDTDHPITRGAANFDFDDEIYWDLHLDPKATVLANAFHSVFDITPQMWVVDDGTYRAFVSIQGHNHTSFSHPAWRTLLLRGIAWAGRRDIDHLTTGAEVEALRYPPGGPLPPSRAHEPFVLHEDFELGLVAAEPVVVNPISIDWDLDGRMWVALTPGYPYKEEFSGVPAHDRIAILHDEDGDGRMDRAHTFADGLDLVTSLVFHEDGVIVSASPEILWLRDTDGDDVADVREVLFSGFGYGDTHAVVSNLRRGLDGWIYATQGYSGNASRNIVNADGADLGHVPNGLFRFLPDGSAIEAVAVYGSNTWGLDFDETGELFFTMANGSHLRHVVMSEDALGPDRLQGTQSWVDITDHKEVERISRADREPYVQIDFVGAFTAAAGSLIYSGRAWPDEFAGNHFVCEPTVNLVHRDLVAPAGATFRATKPRREEFLASTDPWFRPVHVRTGPDGALYVLDFYGQAAVHNDTRGPKHGPTNAALRPDRDNHHGRIWRVQHREAAARLVEAEASWRSTAAQRRGTSDPASGGATDDVAAIVRSLWAAGRAGRLESEVLAQGLAHRDTGVRRNAAILAGSIASAQGAGGLETALRARLQDENARVRLAAIDALRSFPLDDGTVGVLVVAFGDAEDDWTRSAILRVADDDPTRFLAAVPTLAPRGDASTVFVRGLARRVGRTGHPAAVGETLRTLAHAELAPGARIAGLEALQRELPDGAAIAGPNATVEAVRSLLTAEGLDVAIAALPIADRLPDDDRLRASARDVFDRLVATIEAPDADLAQRERCLATLIAIPGSRGRAIEAAARFLDPYFPLETQTTVIDLLGEVQEVAAAEVLAGAFRNVSPDARERAFAKLVGRADWTARLLDRIDSDGITPTELGPHRVFRLRNHPDTVTAARANAILDRFGGANAKAMDELIAELLPIVHQPGDVVAGKELFARNCATCHDVEGLDGPGANVGPALTGMGAHGAEHLLPFIVDPNRSVEAAYLEYVASTVDGRLVAGVLSYDGPDSIVLSSADGNIEVRRDEIEALRSTGRSPMPTGLESLGSQAIRDILAFLCAGYGDYRIVDIDLLCTASTQAGLYDRKRDDKPMRFTRYGVVDVSGVPMEVLDPERTGHGNNAVVLKGGSYPDWESKLHMPQEVEVPVGFALERMHVLGGISAWGFPCKDTREPVLEWTWNYADGETETVVLHDGVEFADWIHRYDVPGSTYVDGMLEDGSWGQVRTFHVDPSRPDVEVESVTLASFDNYMAPTLLGLTAQLGAALEGHDAEPETPSAAPRVLVVGGGSSHDFERWFHTRMLATLGALDPIEVGPIEYTSDVGSIVPKLAELEVLVLSNNQPLTGEELRGGVFRHLEGGAGLLIVHPAAWYNWPDWPEYNAQLVGGGARSHEAYGTFDVAVADREHPVMRGVPASFEIDDELYRFEHDPGGSSVHVLATGVSRTSGASYPVVWTVAHPAGRIVCVTLGHDGAAHEHPAFLTMMRNACRWLGASGD